MTMLKKKIGLCALFCLAVFLMTCLSAIAVQDMPMIGKRFDQKGAPLMKNMGNGAVMGTVTAVDVNAKTLTYDFMMQRRGMGDEKNVGKTFMVSDTTVIKKEGVSITLSDIKAGDGFMAKLNREENKTTAKEIIILDIKMSRKIRKAEEVKNKVSNALGNSFQRFDKIIAKMQDWNDALKSKGADTSKVELHLNQAKADLKDAKNLLNQTRSLIDSASESDNLEQTIKDAKQSMRQTLAKTKEITSDLRKAHEEIKNLRKKIKK